MFVKHEYVNFCMSGKPLSQGTHISNMKALSEKVKELWPMLYFSLKSVTGEGQGHRSKFLYEWEALVTNTFNLYTKYEGSI